MEAQRPPQSKPEKPFLMQMSIQTEGEGKGPHFKRVRVYPTEDPEDPRPFVVKDSKGNEIVLDPQDQLIAERGIRGTARAETLDKLRTENNSVKRR
ncbi:MAG: hypothetical protein A2958_00670 [Candidatus Levybacteria bacterium RIFCSPLOWO2_01_FULL_38_13]|nr:MAG: hypothetical protein A2629_00565 [Candidatus Levybacteria bacterium RIFCSPHIGHO2_01_FULL_41_15]OGH34800.1 MAG: hypothetical protein A2958_00670 [Candidatus Levybacteria bacterium RIFCSPLOWO2_01_FULL_38_13]